MADMLMRFKRRIISYLYGCKLEVWIKVADLLKLLSNNNDKNRNLLEVPKKLREDSDSQD